MKYIVVYIILLLGSTSLKTEAQKPTIDLLPSAGASIHPQAVVDTCLIPGSLFRVDSLAPSREIEGKIIPGEENKGEQSPSTRRRSTQAVALFKPGLSPLFIRISNPIHFIIYFTALKF